MKVNIQLTDDYRVRVDTYNYILQKKNIVQDKESENYGKEVWHTIGYYSSLERVVDKLVDLEIRQSDLTEISTVVKLVEGIKAEIISNLERVN